jgi:uncharacterized membrane protein
MQFSVNAIARAVRCDLRLSNQWMQAMVATYEIENALRARNTRLLRRALCLKSDERYDLIKNMPMYQFQAAALLLIEHGDNANKMQRMVERNKVEVNKQTNVRDILVQAAKAGDEEAIELLASGLSQEKTIE